MSKIINLEIHLDLKVSDKYFKEWDLVGKDKVNHYNAYKNGERYGNMELWDRVANLIFRNNSSEIWNITCRDPYNTWEESE